ncbi:FadR/GntR family transcriptional regulator [Mailhella massiliensis]|uniref:FadR family transcriptional regulator n=1 Tax=Mailhella massiliensis TaxID=1903261 RepID=A0A921DQU5_9BACT|nr:FadR/GntR family transcriptional regulator [Mailhella massiliensis]HJD96920.1 FadR family transcriptional regulator [Mailhella massiliensis]
MEEKRLSDTVADAIFSMITIEKRFAAGDKLPNENDLSEELGVSRTTLREAVRILAAGNIVEIRRGKGTFVREDFAAHPMAELSPLASAKVNADDLYEMRLIFEPEAAYYATLRATESELQRIMALGENIEQLIRAHKDRTLEEQAFHRSIAKATHNAFMNELMPVIQEAINKGVTLSAKKDLVEEDTISDHRMLMNFMKNRNAEGARNAMRIHILHAIEQLGLKKDSSPA